MKIIDLFKDVEFKDVMKELVITDKKWLHLSKEAEALYKTLLNRDLLMMLHYDVKFTVNRETFDTFIFEPNLDLDSICLTYNNFLNTLVSPQDFNDIPNHLIVACAINYLSLEGTVFTDKEYSEKMKTVMDNLKH